ncbi:MAG TPA: HisA/HisF-related TIM barrel protein [Actinomycetota bacterium]|nr:HisA/HisF-related TIM barrel protein [Actinomycetota bacterium]
MFTIFVAIDLSGGRVVRLLRGDPAAATVYGEDPVATARSWQDGGATFLHVVDLDGAIRGQPANAAVIEQILRSVDIPVEVAGGIRSVEAIGRWLDAGAARVCVGTRAIDEEFLDAALGRYGDGVVAAMDARGGTVQVAGWQSSSALSTGEVLGRLARAGAPRVLFTDIGRDGTLEGPNLDATREVLDAGMGVIASGGVSGVGDIEALVGLGHPRLEGVVVGKALYSGAVTLADALAAAAKGA